MIFGIALLIIAIVGIIVLLILKLRPFIATKQRQFFLRHRFISLSPLAKREADENLNRQLTRLKQKFPGRSREWYLEKAVYDLERDRR